ncbi:magnesium transporter [Paracoccus salsus]|uniref:magnesium transporter n=1 Tax=Paracoccus salsus TaxID=2911061 RepID=UPI001F1F99C0|nr:magnesium transporter [Paracoccus salsus]MCF3974674.1 magnesium transporter [Paracoccus salsus]
MAEISFPREPDEFERWIAKTDAHAVAKALNRCAPDERIAAFRRLPQKRAGRVLSLLDPVNQADVLLAMPETRRRVLLNDMEPDDRARLFASVPASVSGRMLDDLSAEERASTEALLRHRPESAGRIMSPEFLSLGLDMTVSAALDAIREGQERAETIYLMPVVQKDMQLIGMLDLARLVLAEPDALVAELVREDVPVVSVDDDQEDVARLMKGGDLMVVPVVENRRLVGIITFDDAMEVLEFEEGEDFARTGASEPLGRPYLAVPILRLVRARILWLSLLAVAAALTVNVLRVFETMLESAVTLTLFIPLLIGIGGNTGAQSATTIVRALAVHDVQPADVLKVALREAATGLTMGLLIAAAALALVSYLFDPDLAVVVAVTLVAICLLAALVGSVMPIFARLLGIDPAVFSAPFVTTIVDTTGLIVYFLVARLVLGL